jgi:hypothetical protein
MFDFPAQAGRAGLHKVRSAAVTLVEGDCYHEVILRHDFNLSDITLRSGKRRILRCGTLKINRSALLATTLGNRLSVI